MIKQLLSQRLDKPKLKYFLSIFRMFPTLARKQYLTVLKCFHNAFFLCYFLFLLFNFFYLNRIESFDSSFLQHFSNHDSKHKRSLFQMEWKCRSPDACLPLWAEGKAWATWYLPVLLLHTSHLWNPLQSLTDLSQVSNAGKVLFSSLAERDKMIQWVEEAQRESPSVPPFRTWFN